MFGWFGSWTAAAKSNSLIGLPDSTDFVSLWLCWGNLNEAQQADLKSFPGPAVQRLCSAGSPQTSARTSPPATAVCLPIEAAEEFWGFTNGDVPSMIEAARKYADAIADTCDKYNIDGFDMDIESTGTLSLWAVQRHARYRNEFLRQLRKRFDESGRMLVIDIPEVWDGSTTTTILTMT